MLKAAMGDILLVSTLERRKSAYPHIRNPDYDQALIREASRIANDKYAPVAWMFDTLQLNNLIKEVSIESEKGTDSRSFTGGGNAAYMLIQLIEMNRWMDDYQVSI